MASLCSHPEMSNLKGDNKLSHISSFTVGIIFLPAAYFIIVLYTYSGFARRQSFMDEHEMVITKRIGRTTYRVKVNLTNEGHETMEDKLLRIILNQPLVNGSSCGIIDVPQMNRSV